VCAAFGHAKQIVNIMPAAGRERGSLLRLRLSYKITDSKTMGICSVLVGTNVPYVHGYQSNIISEKSGTYMTHQLGNETYSLYIIDF
jgi:hypothetical protein